MNWNDFVTIILPLAAFIGAGFAWIYNRLDKKFDKIDKKLDELSVKIDKTEAKLTAKIDSKLEPIIHSINDLDKRMYGIETVLHMKDCCVLKQDQNLRKAE
jgi:hypothetical protein